MAASMSNMWRRTTLLRFARQCHANRRICTCHALQNDVMKSKTMQKLMSKQKNKRIGHILIRAPRPSVKVGAGPRPTKMYRRVTAGAQKRLDQMGAIYHEHLVQILAEGELDFHLEILEVKVTQDMSSINVHWEGVDDKDQDSVLQQTLDQHAGSIRHNLQSRNILGYVPKIVFVKDLAAAKEKKLDEIFNRLGLDPSRLPEEYDKVEDESQDSENPGDDTTSDTTEDKFRQDIYGLQHNMLMQKVVEAKQGKPVGPEIVVSEVDPELMSKAARKEYIQKFSKHLKGEKVQKQKERRIKEYISEQYYRQTEEALVDDFSDLSDDDTEDDLKDADDSHQGR